MRIVVSACLAIGGCSSHPANVSSVDGAATIAPSTETGTVDAGEADTTAIDRMPVLCGPRTSSFYDVTLPLPTANGSVMKCEISDPTDGGFLWPGYRAYRVQYKSSQVVHDGDGGDRTLDVPASGEVFVPLAGGSPYVLAETHGTSGIIADPACAPTGLNWVDTTAMPAMVSAAPPGAIVVAPDYFGLGTDDGERPPDHAFQFVDPLDGGIDTPLARISHPYVSLESEGRATVDLVRAARDVLGSNLGSSPAWLVFGVSQGGHAALGTGEVVARGYGADLQLKGILAAEPASELDYGVPYADGGLGGAAQGGYLEPDLSLYLYEEVFAGLSLENPFQTKDFYTDYALGAFAHTAGAGCQGDVAWIAIDNAYLVNGHPWFQSSIAPAEYDLARNALTANSPGHAPSLPGAPAFVIQVVGGPVVWKERTDLLVARERATNSPADWTYCLWQGQNLTEPDGGATPYTDRGQNHDGFAFAFGTHGAQNPICVLSDGGVVAEDADYVRRWTTAAFAR